MDTRNWPGTAGIDALMALPAWWDIADVRAGGGFDRQAKRLQQFATDIQKTCSDAYGDEMNAWLGGNDRLGRSIQDLMRCRQPQDLLAAESEFLTILFEGASLQAARWADLARKLQGCWAAIARDGASDMRELAGQTATTGGDGAADRTATKPVRGRAAEV